MSEVRVRTEIIANGWQDCVGWRYGYTFDLRKEEMTSQEVENLENGETDFLDWFELDEIDFDSGEDIYAEAIYTEIDEYGDEVREIARRSEWLSNLR